jgi:glycosyltransferase involved in cell wall biosynthesis
MRILHVTDGYRPRLGGIEVFVEDLGTRQASAGHDVTVLTATAPGPDPAPSPAGPVRVVRTPPTVWHPLAGPRAREAALAGPYDVVHAHLSVVSPFATTVARAADEAGIATVNTVHSMWASRRRYVRAVRTLADWDNSDSAWTTVSRAAAEDVRALLHPSADVQVVANAVDVSWWRAGSWSAGRAAGDPVTIVSVMRLAGRKRPGPLLRMLDDVRTSLPEVPVRALIIGDGPLEARLRAEVRARGLDDQVALVGRLTREEIRDLYDEADIYVAPAYEESFGIAALEARAAGLPVVAMQTGGVRDFIRHGSEGLLCRDDQAMAAALVRLVADRGLRAAIAAHNRTFAPDHDWPRALAEFDDVYHRARDLKEAKRSAGDVARGGAGIATILDP